MGKGQREQKPKLLDLIQTTARRGAPTASSMLLWDLCKEISISSSPSSGAALGELGRMDVHRVCAAAAFVGRPARNTVAS